MSKELIWRYRPPSRVDEVLKNYLWFSHWSQLNDPFEFLPFLDFRPESHIGPVGDTDSATHELAKAVAEAYVPHYHLQRFRSETAAVGVCCFSRTSDSLLMWSHYADGHRGFALGFDSGHEFFKERELPDENCLPNRRDVQYVLGRPRVALRDLTNAATIATVLFTKPIEWSYEREVRRIHPISREKQRVVFPLEALKEVVMGCQCQKDMAMMMYTEVSKRAPWVRWHLSRMSAEEFKLTRMPLPISTRLGRGGEMIHVRKSPDETV